MLGNFLAIGVLILVAAFFSSSEIAYVSASELRLRHAAERGGKLQKLTYRLFMASDQTLTAILIGNNLANMYASTIATMIVLTLLGSGYAWLSTVATTILVLIFGEILPKVVAKQNPERVASLVAIPLCVPMFIFKPIAVATTWLIRILSRLWKSSVETGPSVTEDDLEIILDTVEDEGIIDEETTELLQSALDFDDVLAFEIITPRVDMVAIDIEDDYNEIINIALSSPYSRIPVYEGSIDNVIGILHLNRLLKRLVDDIHPDLRSLLIPANFIHKTMPLPSVLETMKEMKCHMVVVSDEYGGTMGILTMEDVLEQLVGDIWDESDVIEDEFRQLSPSLYQADGDMRLPDFFAELDMEDRDFENDNATLGGWSIEMLGGFPKVGDAFVYKQLTITVEKMHKRRVTGVLVAVRDENGAEEEASEE